MDAKFIESLWKVHLFCCFYLTGLIWTIQSVHYPAYHYIEGSKFTAYQLFHTKWITPVVAPVMIVELITAFLLCYAFLKMEGAWFWQLNLVGAALLWLATFFVSVPAHNVLMQGYDFAAAQRLISTNWIRTAVWTLRSAALLFWWIKT